MSNELSLSAAREARIDRAIDRAVRQMIQVDPPAGLRRRVLTRLDQPARRAHLLPRFAFAVVALAIVVLSLSQVWYRADPPIPPTAPVMATRSIEQVIVPSEQLNPSPTPAQVTRERIEMPRVTNVFGNKPGELTAATIDGGKRAIAVSPLTIVPLSARPIVIAPLVLPGASKGGQ